MGILQAAYRTYENYQHLAGKPVEPGREPLIPVSHQIFKAELEITLSPDGKFRRASAVAKEDQKTVIPVTIASANRTSKPDAHALCEQLIYLVPESGERFQMYVKGLRQWACIPDAHPIVKAVLQYIEGGTILTDLACSGLIQLTGMGKLDKKNEKSLVRWIVLASPDGESRCWKNQNLLQQFSAYYAAQLKGEPMDLCMITGKPDVVCSAHPKGVLAYANGAKLVSANDGSGFTSRGRFCLESEASNVGYFASQKAHSALRYLAANHGVRIGDRMFLCWNPEGKSVPSLQDGFGLSSSEAKELIDYQAELHDMLYGKENRLEQKDDVVVATLEAATTGRLSVTYYRELKASDYLNRIEKWYGSCCYLSRNGIRSPGIPNIVRYAYGVLRAGRMEVDAKLFGQQVQLLVHCLVDAQPVPQNLVLALFHRADRLQTFEAQNEAGTWNPRAMLLHTACAVIRKYRNETCKEEWKLTLDTENKNRSYLFGRLLAVAELVERFTYDENETREPNAIRMQTVFSRRPMYAWRIIRENLNPYFARLTPARRNRYQRWIDEIMEGLRAEDIAVLNQPLQDVYLLGYSHQRTAILNRPKPEKEKLAENGAKEEEAEP